MLVPRFCSLSGSTQCDMKTPGRRITANTPEANLRMIMGVLEGIMWQNKNNRVVNMYMAEVRFSGG